MSILPHTTSHPDTSPPPRSQSPELRLQVAWTVRRRHVGCDDIRIETVTADIHPDRLVLTRTDHDHEGESTHEAIPISLRIWPTSAVAELGGGSPLIIDIWNVGEEDQATPLARLHRTSPLDWVVRTDIPRKLGMMGGTYRLEAVRELPLDRGAALRT